MTTDHISRIEAALEANPTPGPWYLRTNRHPATNGRPWGWLDPLPPGAGQGYIAGVKVTWERGDQSEANAAYIAACNPQAIRALLDRLNKAEDEHKMMEQLLLAEQESKRELYAEIERLREVLDRLARLGNGRFYGNSEGNMIAREALENTDGK